VDRTTGALGNRPLRDLYSHGADAFRYLAMGIRGRSGGAGRLRKRPGLTKIRTV